MFEQISKTAFVPINSAGQRLDQVAAELFTDFSRSQLQTWVREGSLLVNGQSVAKPKQRLVGGEQLSLNVQLQAHGDDLPEPIPLNVLYTDEHLLIVNKPPSMVVHPGAGNRTGTLVNALLHYDAGLQVMPRAGIVHRLDKDTSGALLVAKTDTVRQALTAQLKARDIHRHYQALVWGQPPRKGSIDLPLGRHPVDRIKMAVRPEHDTHARHAVTHFKVREQYAGLALLDVKLETGRTHQIRVHLTHQGFPMVGDPLYIRKGSDRQLIASEDVRQQLQLFSRQWLHASRLQLQHPVTGEFLDCKAPLPEDLTDLLELVRSSVGHSD